MITTPRAMMERGPRADPARVAKDPRAAETTTMERDPRAAVAKAASLVVITTPKEMMEKEERGPRVDLARAAKDPRVVETTMMEKVASHPRRTITKIDPPRKPR
jgi:hypothetical protein